MIYARSFYNHFSTVMRHENSRTYVQKNEYYLLNIIKLKIKYFLPQKILNIILGFIKFLKNHQFDCDIDVSIFILSYECLFQVHQIRINFFVFNTKHWSFVSQKITYLHCIFTVINGFSHMVYVCIFFTSTFNTLNLRWQFLRWMQRMQRKWIITKY